MLADGQAGPFSIEVQAIEVSQSEGIPLSAESPASVQDVFAVAISEGAPLYNQGEAERCADVYQSAIVTVLLLRPDDLAAGEHARLAAAVRAAREVRSPTERAWLLRDAMDATMGLP